MFERKMLVLALGGAATIAACAASSSTDRAVGRSAGATTTEVRLDPCGDGRPVLCTYGNITLWDGGPPRPTDGCSGLIDISLSSDNTSFTWSSRNGQLIDAVVVSADGTSVKHTYDPAATSDSTPIVSPTGQSLDDIDFCGTYGAHADAGATDDASTPPPPSTDDDAGSGGKAW